MPSSTVNWEQISAAWGPAIPMFLVMVYYIHRLVNLVIPRGLRRLRQTIAKEGEKADARHREAITILESVEQRLDEMPVYRRQRRRDRPAKKRPAAKP